MWSSAHPQRNDFDEKKAYAKLLDALIERVERALHQPIPAIPPYSPSELFHILPLPKHTDVLGRPVAVLCPRDIKRNKSGELEDLIEWTWWCCETLRRTLQDYWDARLWGLDRKGSGGEGCVVIVDAAGAGYRNLVSENPSRIMFEAHGQEVELLPALTKVGSRNFPGMVQAVFIVNAGWTQRSLWTIVRKVVPKAAVERIKFVDTPGELGQYFDMAKLPPGESAAVLFLLSAHVSSGRNQRLLLHLRQPYSRLLLDTPRRINFSSSIFCSPSRYIRTGRRTQPDPCNVLRVDRRTLLLSTELAHHLESI